MKIALASDHAGYELKIYLIDYLTSQNHEINDYGCYSGDSVDYADFAHPMALSVENGENEMGVAVCGSGNGINMTANKHQGIRSALCWNVEIARLSRMHNNANVCALPARFVTKELALEILNAFLSEAFEGGRHIRRIEKMPINKQM